MAFGVPLSNFTAIGFNVIMLLIDIAVIAILVSSTSREGRGFLIMGVILHMISNLCSGMMTIAMLAQDPMQNAANFHKVMMITSAMTRLCLIVGAILAGMGLNQLFQRNRFLEKLLNEEQDQYEA